MIFACLGSKDWHAPERSPQESSKNDLPKIMRADKTAGNSDKLEADCGNTKADSGAKKDSPVDRESSVVGEGSVADCGNTKAHSGARKDSSVDRESSVGVEGSVADCGNTKPDSAASGNSGQQEPTVLDKGLPKFGPFYVDEGSVSALKEQAWQHIVRETVALQKKDLTEEESKKVKEVYMSAMRSVQEAKAMYADDLPQKDSVFHEMMIEDGCFFLQLSLMILGGQEILGYPSDNVIFGNNEGHGETKEEEKREKEASRLKTMFGKEEKKEEKRRKKHTKWLEAMFFVGNQIPAVVLQKLMEQDFFKQVLKKRRWEIRPSLVLSERVLYEFFVLPSTHASRSDLKGRLCWRGRRPAKVDSFFKNDMPSDLLHGIRELILGRSTKHQNYEPDGQDLEANWRDSTTEENPKINVTSLINKGIQIKHIPGAGARGIYFEETCCSACLYLPTFSVEDDLEMILENVKRYEILQHPNKNQHEVCSYLRFMGEIIRTPEDVKLLSSKGIIQGSQENIYKLPGILRRLYSEDLTQHLYVVKLHISSYSIPVWQKYLKQILSVVAVLTLIQTIYAVVSYHLPASRH